MQFHYQTTSPQETEGLAEKIGQQLKGGEVIELSSDLGGGKTTFVRGLARGFGSPDRVASPTFTISKVYKNGKKELHHFDFYRLQESGLIAHELDEVIHDPLCTVVVEWAEVVSQVLPDDRLSVKIKQAGQDNRSLDVSCPEKLSYLLARVTS